MMAAPDDGFDAMAPENVSPLVVWLGSEESADVTGQMFEVDGGRICSSTAGNAAPRSTRAPAGTPPNSAPWSANSSPTTTRSPSTAPEHGPGIGMKGAFVHLRWMKAPFIKLGGEVRGVR